MQRLWAGAEIASEKATCYAQESQTRHRVLALDIDIN